jgi:hypothetical protein
MDCTRFRVTKRGVNMAEDGASIIHLSMSDGALGVLLKYFTQSEPSGNSRF